LFSIPYAPYSKSDKLGRFADWTEGDGRDQRGQTATGAGGNPRGGTRAGGRRDGAQAYGSNAGSAFAYFHQEDEASFSLVDNRTGGLRRPGATSAAQRGMRGTGSRTQGRTGALSRGGYSGRGYGRGGGGFGGRGPRRGWRDWEKVTFLSLWCSTYAHTARMQTSRVREGSVVVDPTWRVLEEIEFNRLNKLRLDVDSPETL
jgi:translation initiation factor 3 subunit D